MDEMQEILEDFLVEAFEMNEQLDQDLVELENNPEDLELLNRIFRVAHTIKGSSSFLNFDVLTHLTHHMEDVLNKARKGELKIVPDIMDVVLESIDAMKALLSHIKDTGADADHGLDVEAIVKKLDVISKGGEIEASQEEEKKEEAEIIVETPKKEEKDDTNYADLSEDQLEDEIERLLRVRQEEDKARRKAKKKAGNSKSSETKKKEVKATPEKTAPPPPPPPPPPKKEVVKKVSAKKDTKKKAPPAKPSMVEQTIRVDVKRLDNLMNLIGELVLSKNRLMKIYTDVEERYEGEKFLEELNQVVSSVSIVTTDLQIAVMKTRMLPVGKVFNKFPRMVRDLSRELSKQIDLVITGEDTELDKSIVEEIGDPLVHIIRNSCDHGIEIPDIRVAGGKTELGTIILKAYNEGNHIVIEIRDDGKGLDTDMLKMKCVEKEIISEREADNMSDKEAFALIFRPGFSTAAKVTNVSGRGVGMDVVKTNIEKLNGIIDIDSEMTKGTVIKLKIPLTLAIIQALLVGVEEEYYAIPIASVLETVRVTNDEIYTVEGKNVLRLRDEVLPLVRLAGVFGIDSILEQSEHTYVVVIGLAESKLGVIVDFLVGQEEVVIKSLGNYLKGIDGIAGATIRGDGKVTLIVDVAAMMELAKNSTATVVPEAGEAGTAKVKTKPSDYIVLIVDDSPTDRMVMRKALEPLGLTLVEAANGIDALNLVKSGDHAFDAALVDIEMPRMDGYTLATEIRKYNRFKNLPLIAVTSRTSKSDRLRGVESGMSEYITKPYSPDYLQGVVSRNIGL